ncbi:MAG: hypothetical protein OHK0029_42500 [Armatimonadaceae bacterium]
MKKVLTGITIATLLAGTALVSPVQAQTARQKDKNAMRNLGIGLGAAAIHEAAKGRNTNALVLGAGAAYAGKKYEDARKAQARENRITRRYVYKNGKRVGYYKMKNGKRIGYVRFRR